MSPIAYRGFTITKGQYASFNVSACNCFGAKTLDAAKRAIDAYCERCDLDLNGIPYLTTYKRSEIEVNAMRDALHAVKTAWGGVALTPEDRDAEIQKAYRLRLSALVG